MRNQAIVTTMIGQLPLVPGMVPMVTWKVAFSNGPGCR